jgi:hypothetical protein
MNVVLLRNDHRLVSATHVAIFRVVRTRIQVQIYMYIYCNYFCMYIYKLNNGTAMKYLSL